MTPMVVTGLLGDSLLLVHLLEELEPVEKPGSAAQRLAGELTSDGFTVLSGSPPVASADVPVTLSPRELEVLHRMARGWETSRIAGELGISPHTVRNHIRNLRTKLKATTKLEAVVIGIRQGILPADYL